MISSWAIYTKISWYVKCSKLCFFYEQPYIAMWCERFMWKNSTWPLLHYTYSFFPSVSVNIYQKHNFLKICIAGESDTRQKSIFDVICHVICHIFCRAETVHDDHHCFHWGNLMHIYVIFQYSIILEIIICRILVVPFVSWFHYSFLLSVCITVDEKHFCQICSSCNISKNYTYNKLHVWCDLLCDIFVKFAHQVLQLTTQQCIFDVICHVNFCTFLYSWNHAL